MSEELMNVSKFLVLGSLIRLETGSGYDIKKELDRNMVGEWTNIKTGSIYFSLEKLKDSACVLSIGSERQGEYPEKTLYRVSEKGFALFREMQDEAFLGIYPYFFGFKMAYKFNHDRTDAEICEFGRTAIERIEKILGKMDSFKAGLEPSDTGFDKDLECMQHDYLLYDAEKSWINSIISRHQGTSLNQRHSEKGR